MGEGVKLWPYAEGAIIIITTVSFLVLIFLSVVSVFFLYLGSISLGPVQRHKAGGKTKGGGTIKKARGSKSLILVASTKHINLK